MLHLSQVTERYCQSFDWKSLSLFKLCCLSFGMVCGIFIPNKYKRPVLIGATGVFVVTYLPLMCGFIKTIVQDGKEGA